VIGDGIRALDLTVDGRRWVANLYAHVFAMEHDRRRMGPHPGLKAATPLDLSEPVRADRPSFLPADPFSTST
jgi:hypothetical protein